MQSPLRSASALLLTAAAGSVLAQPAHADTPMSYLSAFGRQAKEILPLTLGMGIISLTVITVIIVLLVLGLLRAGPYEGPTVERRELETAGGGLPWLYIGVGVSTIVLFATAVWAMVTLAAVTPSSTEKAAVTIEVTGHQWWWEVRYLSDQPSQVFTTANEIHIPVGKPVKFKLASADVIHSFWIPKLGGKTDLIPGQTNIAWLEADKPGVYRGQCVEYCGKQHAHMALFVVASPPKQFEAWRNEQLKGAPAPTEKLAEGKTDFIQKCGICHTVLGTRAQGKVGPNLSHLMERRTLAAGTLPNNTGNLAAWISNPQHIKPGSYMPQPEVTPAQLQRILAFLQTLK